MFNGFEEHFQHSAPDNSRFDGFDRGDIGNTEAATAETVIGRMSCWHGTVEVVEVISGYDSDFYVRVDGRMVTDLMDRDRAIEVGRWWVKGAQP